MQQTRHGRALSNEGRRTSTPSSEPAQASDGTVHELTWAIRQLLLREQASGTSKVGNPYWGAGSRNVGHAELAAVTSVVLALRHLNASTVALADVRSVIEQAYLENRYDPDDEDGFGAATYHGLMRGIAALIERFGPDAAVSVHGAMDS